MTTEKLLDKNNIKYIREYKFIDCKNIKPLPFDFFLFEYNTCIEYDGEQHFKINKYFGGEKGLLKRQKNDNIKNEYCINNNIRLIRIKYNENIEEKFNRLLDTIKNDF